MIENLNPLHLTTHTLSTAQAAPGFTSLCSSLILRVSPSSSSSSLIYKYERYFIKSQIQLSVPLKLDGTRDITSKAHKIFYGRY